MNPRVGMRGPVALLVAAIMTVAVAAIAQTPPSISPDSQQRIIDAPGVSVGILVDRQTVSNVADLTDLQAAVSRARIAKGIA